MRRTHTNVSPVEKPTRVDHFENHQAKCPSNNSVEALLFTCNNCDQSFKKKQNLKKHMEICLYSNSDRNEMFETSLHNLAQDLLVNSFSGMEIPSLSRSHLPSMASADISGEKTCRRQN